MQGIEKSTRHTMLQNNRKSGEMPALLENERRERADREWRGMLTRYENGLDDHDRELYEIARRAWCNSSLVASLIGKAHSEEARYLLELEWKHAERRASIREEFICD